MHVSFTTGYGLVGSFLRSMIQWKGRKDWGLYCRFQRTLGCLSGFGLDGGCDTLDLAVRGDNDNVYGTNLDTDFSNSIVPPFGPADWLDVYFFPLDSQTPRCTLGIGVGIVSRARLKV